ncbi:MAG TPA: aldehyde dehydrogenase family protein, partial [Opitutaceae bacterium]
AYSDPNRLPSATQGLTLTDISPPRISWFIPHGAAIDDAAGMAAAKRLWTQTPALTDSGLFFVDRRVQSKFVTALGEKFQDASVGDPGDTKTDVGPLPSAEARQLLHDCIRRAVSAGAQCHRWQGTLPKGGFYYPPTVLFDVTVDMEVARTGIDGTVAVVVAVDSWPEAEGISRRRGDDGLRMTNRVFEENRPLPPPLVRNGFAEEAAI